MDAATAKQRSEQWIAAAGVIVNSNLPHLEEPIELAPRSAREVAIRASVLGHVVYLGYGHAGEKILNRLESVRLVDALSPQERELCSLKKLNEQQQAWAAWQAEALHGCAWALGVVETAPLDECPDTLESLFDVKVDPWTRIEAATLRSFDEIYSRADTLYRLHWAAVESRFGGTPLSQPEPAIMLRRHSLDWIVGVPYEWDNVPHDT